MVKTPKDVFEEKPITLAEVKDILKKRESEGELTYVQQITLEYANNFCKYSLEDALKLKEEIVNKFKISELTAVQIVNLSNPPTHPLELNIILDKEPTVLSEDQKAELIALIKEYAERSH